MSQPRNYSLNPGPGGAALPVPPAPERDNRRGLIWILISVFGASIMTITARQLSIQFDSRMIVLFRSVGLILVMVPLLILISPLRRQLRFSRPGLHILRGVFVGVSTHLGFYTITVIPLATATVLFFTAPVFATLLAMIFHKEKIGPRRLIAIVTGFLGALVILRPGVGEIELGMFTALGSSLLYATVLTMSRGMAQADGPFSTFFSSTLATALISIPLAASDWEMPVGIVTWAIIAVLLIASAMRNIADIEAYRHAEAAVLAPFTYLRLVLIGLAGYLLFDEVPDVSTLVGAAIIIGSTFYVAQREAALKRAAKRKRKVAD